MVGLFLNALPVRTRLAATTPLIPWLRELQAHQTEARRYEYTPLADIQKWSDVPHGQQLFDSTLAFENFPVEQVLKEQRGPLEITDNFRYGGRSNYPINVAVEPSRELMIEIGYDRLLSERSAIARMLKHFALLLERFAELASGDAPDWILELAFSEQARLERALKNPKGAIETLQRGIEKVPAQPLFLQLAFYLDEANRPGEAALVFHDQDPIPDRLQ